MMLIDKVYTALFRNSTILININYHSTQVDNNISLSPDICLITYKLFQMNLKKSKPNYLII